MKDIFRIFIRDLNKIRNNIAAIVIVLGLCILPSLYAWINIIACWDPYANTGNLPVAVINKDSGAIINGEEINIGDQVEEQLRTDTAIKWQFEDEWLANNDLYGGKYYAIIEIPEDFSKGVASLTTENPKKPSIIYKANEKKNAIATKITNVAKDKLTKKIKTNFVETVNKEAFNELNRVGEYLDTNRNKILGLKDVVSTANENLEQIKSLLTISGQTSEETANYFQQINEKLPLISDQINHLQGAISSSKDLINSQKEQLINLNNELSSDLTILQSKNQNNNDLINNLKNTSEVEKQKETLNQISDNLARASSITKSDMTALDELNQDNLSGFNKNLSNVSNDIANEQNKIKQLKDSDEALSDSAISELQQLQNQLTSSIINLSNSFYTSASSSITNNANMLNTQLTTISSMLEITRAIQPQLELLTNFGSASASHAASNADKMSEKISSIQENLNKLKEGMDSINDKSIDEIVELMSKNPDEVGDFISSPIEVKQVDVYGEGIFGVGLTPFYGVLAIWVGALLGCAILTTECEEFEDGTKLSMVKKHFGKMTLFLVLSFIQSIIMVLGLMFILKINVQNVPLLFGFTILTSITFTIIIFTLVSLLGNVGKAVAVIIMVFQIAGAGGIYPIQTNPQIFGILYPLWPFTYAINGFREAISGEVWQNVFKNVVPLILFCISFLLLSVLKAPLHKITHFMEEKFKESEM